MRGGSFGNFKKLAIAMTGMLVSMTLLVTAGFAWYTLSTNPEIQQMRFTLGASEDLWISVDGVNFYKDVDISNTIEEGLDVLRPVSTYDGLHWYVCSYQDGSGDVVDGQFYLKKWCVDEDHDTDPDHSHCNNGGFYAYADIWLKTTQETSTIRLSMAGEDKDYESEEVSGCFLLSYALEEAEDGSTVVKLMEQGPETCARVGLMVLGSTQEGDEAGPVVLGPTEDLADRTDLIQSSQFFIYEPNADVRSELDKQSDRYLTDKYISRFQIKNWSWNYVETAEKKQYLQTFPIKLTNDLGKEYDQIVEGTLQEANPALFPAERLVVQRSVKWDKEKIAQAIAAGTLDTNVSTTAFLNQLMSNDYFLRDAGDTEHGRFMTTPSTLYGDLNTYTPKDMTSATASASQPLFTITSGTITQVRIFFWIEGQDLDCWNDVAGMNFLARLEFATN